MPRRHATGSFPSEEHAYKMVDGELPKLEELLDD
jgi:hypothetical protein